MVGSVPILSLDLRAVAEVAAMLGYDQRAVLLLAPAIEAGMVAARDGLDEAVEL